MRGMAAQEDLQVVAEQERVLVWARFGAPESWAVGSALRAEALRRGAAMSFEVTVAGRLLFACATDGAAAGQADWIRRKRNTVMRFGRSSYALGLELALSGKSLGERHGLELKDFAMHGGGVPVLLAGTGVVGSVVASGLDQRVDHAMVVEAMGVVLGVQAPGLD